MTQTALDPTAWIVESGTAYASIGAALTAASEGDHILLSEGVFSGTLTTGDDNLTITGAGRGKTVLTGNTFTSPGLTLQDLTIKVSGTVHGISGTGDTNMHFIRVDVWGSTTSGYWGFELTECGHCLFDDVNIKRGYGGIHMLTNTGYIEKAIFRNVRVYCATYGLYLEDGNYDLEHVWAADAGSYGVRFDDCESIVMRDVHTNDGESGGIRIDITGTENTHVDIQECSSTFNNGVGLTLDRAATATIRGSIRNNAIHGNGTDALGLNSEADLEYNWWGTDAPQSGQFTNVDYTPWLLQPSSITHNAKMLQDVHDTLDTHETGQATSRGIISTNLDQVLSTTEGNIRGAESDDLKDISDQLDNVEPEAEVRITAPSMMVVPTGQNALDGELAAGANTLTLDDADLFTNWGYVQIEDEICYYTDKSTDTLTGLIRGMFGTGDATHVDATAVYQAVAHRVKMTIHDAGVPKAPSGTPQIEAVNMAGTTKITSGNMTQEGAEVGIYYYDIILKSDENAPQLWDVRITATPVAGKTNEYREVIIVLDKPASESDVITEVTPANLRICTQDGYYDNLSVFHAWTDALVGAMEDDNSNLIFRGEIRFWNKIGGVTQHQEHPPGQAYSDVLGKWTALVPIGTYTVHFWKDGVVDSEVERTVT